MGKQRNSWTGEPKLAVVLATLREEDSIAELSRRHGVNDNQIYRWKAQFLDGGRQALNGGKAQSADQRLHAENEQLKKRLGEKALEIDVLKKLSRR
jgi:putative transposase